MEHTKGPWKACFPVGNEPFVGNEGMVVVNKVGPINKEKGYSDLQKANARLIAAAPSMYDALAAIANMQVQETTDFRELAALCISIAQIEIAKAEGRS